LKHRGLFDFPTTNSFLFSVPLELAHTKTVIRSLDGFPPAHFSALNFSVLSGVNLKKISVSSAIKMSLSL
jgi:hypothetical protein